MATWNSLAAKKLSGSRVSPAVSLAAPEVAQAAVISWDATVPEGTGLVIEAAVSADGGVTWGAWLACTNGQAMPGIAKGLDLANVYVKTRQSFSTTDNFSTPVLRSLQITVTAGYKSGGVLTSVAMDYAMAQISWEADLPAGTAIVLEYREGDGSSWGNWYPVAYNNICGSKSKLQYRVTFTTTDAASSPALGLMRLTKRNTFNLYAISPAVDASKAIDVNSGKVTYEATFSGTASAEVYTRASADGSGWGAWSPVEASGNVSSVHNNYIQVMVLPTGDNGANAPVFNNLTVSYDGTPTAAELSAGFAAGGQFYFATLLSKLIITNMLDAPKKWDGTGAVENVGGSPPHGQYVTTHKNYLFMARTVSNPNRLYFSEVLNLDSWPVLNFIDISPNDGDWITGLLPYDDYLVVTKNRSVWLLVGTGTSDFEIRRIHDGVGCVAPRSLTKMAQSFVFASSEGLYMSDLSNEVLLSERLKETWRGLSQRRLNQIAATYYDHKLRIDVPDGSSTVNNLRIIYDSIQKALSLEEFSAHASCYTRFTESGHEILLYGHAGNGQVSRADYGSTDNGLPIGMDWGTKYFNFGSSAVEKKLRYLYLVVIPAASDTVLTVYLVLNGVRTAQPLVLTVPGDAHQVARTVKLDPRSVGVRKMKTIGYDVVQESANGGVKIHELLQEYMVRKIKETK